MGDLGNAGHDIDVLDLEAGGNGNAVLNQIRTFRGVGHAQPRRVDLHAARFELGDKATVGLGMANKLAA